MRQPEIDFGKDELITIEHLRKLRLPGMAAALEDQLRDPNADLKPFFERFYRIVDKEWNMRHEKKFKRYLKQAKLRYPAADIDDTIHDPARQLDADSIMRLSTCSWIDEGRNLLVTGKSSSGKTYLCNALCVSALRQLKTVFYLKASRLIGELDKARLNETYFDFVDVLSKYDLLVIDDFGLMTLDMDKCRDLLEVIDSRDGRKSTIVISQLPVKDWFDLFQDNTYADACLTRLTDKRHSYRLEMNGRNMRDPE